MKFKEYDVVRTLQECEEGVNKGEVGTVVMTFEIPNEAYEVEFLDKDGQTKALCTLLPEEIEIVKK
ncbi:DUF4926 domain-containing protein [Listeria costaricensis]|uniref:DUF4926 domain-containing protein n=1 Tax=Listeria costaricensis TaxID=2026604 RepID=UPI000C079A5A|nr:DUF4926 domain-containing protein [Listeria costaricensis]